MRPPLEMETWGKIRRKTVDGVHKAYCRYRDLDGVTRIMERRGKTQADAERNLIRALKKRLAPVSAEMTRETTIRALAEQWVAQVEASDLADGSKNQYKTNASTVIRELGGVRIGEATIPRLERYLGDVRERRGPGAARSARLVLKLMLAIPVRYGVLDANPINETTTIARPKTVVKALRQPDIAQIRDLLHAHDTGVDAYGRPRDGYLRDVADMYIATGARTSEILAVGWPDIALDATPQTVDVWKTVARGTDGKLHIQEHPKTDAGERILELPASVSGMLIRRRIDAYSELVFPSAVGTPIWPDNLRRAWKAALSETPYAEVTPKAFRKAVATLLDEELGGAAARDQLGHVSESTTRRHYIERRRQGPAVAAVLEHLFVQNDGKAMA